MEKDKPCQKIDTLVKKLAKIAELMVRVEGMKATNTERSERGYSLTYDEIDFIGIANKIRHIAEDKEKENG